MDPIQDIKHLYETIYEHQPKCRYDGGPRFLSSEISNSRMVMMEEELFEYHQAIHEHDLEGALDALIDLMVFVSGTAYLHGFSEIFEKAWYRVQTANLKKFAGNKNRGTDCDMVKPDDWEPPSFKDLL